MTTAILTIDQGTTSSRAIIFDENFKPAFAAQQEYQQYYPARGWVEHDPEDIWETTVSVCQEALAAAREKGLKVVGIGLVNQRETTLVWEKKTGKPVYNAIVWQDRRTANACKALQQYEPWITEKTGLRMDPYFSATKIKWILDNVSGARGRAARGELAFGTVDSFLIWRLTGGKTHVTDTTNASRTNLFNLSTLQWDEELLALFNIPAAMMPEIRHCADDFGLTEQHILSESLPICGVAGDQQAALIGQGCFNKGETKTTFGTGSFALVNTGDRLTYSSHNLLTTVAYTLKEQTCYAIEGSIFVAGAAVQWLRDSMGMLSNAAESEAIASSVADDHGLVLVPAFTGLGAPYWSPQARGAIYGLTRSSTSAHVVRATLESVAYQTQDLVNSIKSDNIPVTCMKVDGGMVQNSWLCQYLADTLNVTVVRPEVMETTALGAAFLAGLQLGMRENLHDFATLNPTEAQFTSRIDETLRTQRKNRWNAAVQATLLMAKAEA
ncbi:glycerol kinase GlpK [Alteromonas pelagimontana]|uniref:Glycerol kinase n=1 Tax=Alteromonas pelagimontana TaxID=1858656 RepID=A0A6M4MC28_9ALTE|nr:glycerol kinase GlpK [Alteromonas pelagimontana]QJR80754.1 glycerol kinase GlpK [Alteromonas pelagimontana]